MARQYANDDQLILKIQGLRMVSKEDMIHSMRNETTYRLRWEYKGSSGYMDYDTSEARDQMFISVVAAISRK